MSGRAVLPSLVLAACAGAPTGPNPAPLGRELTLKPGETVTLQGTTASLGFERVSEDSRCPVLAACVWEGRAVVELTLTQDGAGSRLELSTLAPTAAAGSLRLTLLRVEPYPRIDKAIAEGDYR